MCVCRSMCVRRSGVLTLLNLLYLRSRHVLNASGPRGDLSQTDEGAGVRPAGEVPVRRGVRRCHGAEIMPRALDQWPCGIRAQHASPATRSPRAGSILTPEHTPRTLDSAGFVTYDALACVNISTESSHSRAIRNYCASERHPLRRHPPYLRRCTRRTYSYYRRDVCICLLKLP